MDTTLPILSDPFALGFEKGEDKGQWMGEQSGYNDGFVNSKFDKMNGYMMHVDNMHTQLMGTLSDQENEYAYKKRYYEGYFQGFKHGFVEGYKDGADEYSQIND